MIKMQTFWAKIGAMTYWRTDILGPSVRSYREKGHNLSTKTCLDNLALIYANLSNQTNLFKLAIIYVD